MDITDIQDGDAIVYDATAEKYVNKALALEDLSILSGTGRRRRLAKI